MKNLVKFSFSRFAESYHREAILQKKAAEILTELCEDLEGTGIDLGCGTGFVYQFLKTHRVIGIDISKDMIKFYRKINPYGIIGDMEQLPFKENVLDYAISSFSLHWGNLDSISKEIKKVLKDEGKFIFNIPVYGSLTAIEKIIGDRKFDFLGEKEVIQILERNNFFIENNFIVDLKKEFKDGYQLLIHLHKTGVAINTKNQSIGEKKKIVEKFKSFKDPVTLNYRLLFIKATKITSHKSWF
ncbi:methyltransferase domain-containing protein [Persephonella sp.]